MLMKNIEIYDSAMKFANAFEDSNMYLPMKLNFYLQKNKKTLMELSRDIEEARIKIASEYGELTEDGSSYNIPESKIAEASKELNDLFELEQEVNIYKIQMDQIPEHVELSAAQMEAILFMIED